MGVQTADVVIIGGGVIGASTAYFLARAGKDVILLEREDLGAGSSGACDGFVTLQTKKPGIHLRLALESTQLFQDLNNRLKAESGYDIAYRRTGGMIIIENEEQMQSMRQFVEGQRAAGLRVEILGIDEARKLEPGLSERLIGAAFSPDDGQVDPLNLTLAFAAAARRRGVRIMLHTAVTGVRVLWDRVRSVLTNQGEIGAEWVVNAAGALGSEVANLVGLQVPIVPRRGQVLVTEPLPPTFRHVISSARYIIAKFNNTRQMAVAQDEFTRLGVGLALEQTERGNVLIGSSREFVGFDRRVTYEGLQAIARYACHIVPALREVNIIRAFAGLRPSTPDGLPILGGVDGVSGFVMAAGHEGDGITLSPVTGRLIAELISTGKTSIPLAGFSASRFNPESPRAAN
ncbi:MAG: FAD-binding oxidoreductase [Firmicutes bacterium]|nr:FAD-binding oxidoreductase [Bacillota bacterium]